MAPDIKQINASNADREKVKTRKQLFIYLFFLLASIILWYLNALDKDYTTFINYPVVYEQFPKGKALVSELPSKIRLKVRGFGYNILKYKIEAFAKPVVIPVNNFRIDVLRKNNQYEYYLLTRYVKEFVGSQLTNDIQLLEIKPDTLSFKFADVVEKKVPIKPSLDLQYANQFMQNGKMIVIPDSILVSGPQVIIDTLHFLTNNFMVLKKVRDTLVTPVNLLPINGLTFSVYKVQVFVPVTKYTEVHFNVPIEVKNLPENFKVRTFPGYVNLTCWVSTSMYDKLTPFMFRTTIDYAVLGNVNSKAKITLVKYPSYVQNIKFYPKSVEYLIEK